MIQKQFRVPCRSKAQATLPQILALPEENMLQSNRKTVHRVYLEWRSTGSGTLTNVQFAAIAPIAHQCASTGGTAVYLARALYRINENKAFDDGLLCLPAEERTSAIKTRTANKSLLRPNPSDGRFNLWIADMPSEDVALVQITDVFGKTLQSFEVRLSNVNTAIDGSNFSSGLYFCIVRSSSGAIKATLKFVISK